MKNLKYNKNVVLSRDFFYMQHGPLFIKNNCQISNLEVSIGFKIR